MRHVIREVLYVGAVTGASFAAHRFVLLPVLIVLPLLITNTVRRPLIYLLILAAVSELYVVLPFGAASGAVLAPWVLARSMRRHQRIEPDVTVGFLALVAASVLVGTAFLYLPDLWRAASSPSESLAAAVPWQRVLVTSAVAGGVTFLVSILVRYNRAQ